MGHKPTLQDLEGVHPTVYKSLQKLLAADNAAQLGLVFQVMSPPLPPASRPCKSVFTRLLCTLPALMLGVYCSKQLCQPDKQSTLQ